MVPQLHMFGRGATLQAAIANRLLDGLRSLWL